LTGIIEYFLSEKKWGYIKGDNNKKYFFHINDFKTKTAVDIIQDGDIVSFEETLKPKGYSASKIFFVQIDENTIKYIVPDTIYTSKVDNIKGWKTIDKSRYIIHGSSRNSPDNAKKDLLRKAKLYGANSILNLTYYKTTGSEMGTSFSLFSTHKYTIHNFRGNLANIGKPNIKGSANKFDLIGLNECVEKINRNDNNNKLKSYSAFIIIAIFILLIRSIS